MLWACETGLGTLLELHNQRHPPLVCVSVSDQGVDLLPEGELPQESLVLLLRLLPMWTITYPALATAERCLHTVFVKFKETCHSFDTFTYDSHSACVNQDPALPFA